MTRNTPEKNKVIEGVEHIYCSTCKIYIPIIDEETQESNFSNRAASKNGYAYSCKACEREASKKSYKKNKRKAKDKKQYYRHREDHLRRAKERYKDNKDDILQKAKEYRQTDKGKQAVREASQRRRDRIKQNTNTKRNYTEADVIEKSLVMGMPTCGICGLPIDVDSREEWHVDHIIPIAEGGPDLLENVRLTHASCNLTRPKDARDLKEV